MANAIKILRLKDEAFRDRRVRDAIDKGPLEFVSDGWYNGSFRFPIDDEMRSYLLSKDLHSGEEFSDGTYREHGHYAIFSFSQMLGLLYFFEDRDREKKGFGALYPILQAFSQSLGKSITLTRRWYHRLDGSMPTDSFVTTLEPEETMQTRRERISEITARVIRVLMDDSNVARVLLHGSGSYGNPLPGDLDFLVLLKSPSAYSQEQCVALDELNKIAIVPVIACEKVSRTSAGPFSFRCIWTSVTSPSSRTWTTAKPRSPTRSCAKLAW